MSSIRTMAIVVCVACAGASCGGSSASRATSQAPAASQPASSAPAPEAAAPSASVSSDMPEGLPALPVVPFPAARPMPIVRAVFAFAAQHPEVLSKVPCFCGCESRGHRDNDDCFVAARDPNGRVTAWEPHGLG